MSRSGLERLINNDFRLDILCCLVDESLSLAALSARLVKPVEAVNYHLKALEHCKVVEKRADVEGDDALYAASLDGRPPWVREAIADHKDPDLERPDSLAAVRVMVGMKCDGCERLLWYKDQVVAVYDEGGELRAKVVTEDLPGSGEAASLRATEKYHRGCYAKARAQYPLLPSIRS